MRALPLSLLQRWASGNHVGPAKPRQVVRIRQGRMKHGFQDWAGPLVDAEIPGESDKKPWVGYWEPSSEYVELPSVAQVTLDQDFSQRGRTTCTIAMENILYRPQEAMGYLVHLQDRGALSPWRGYVPPGRPDFGQKPNEWSEVLTKNAQITVFQGYGDDLVPTFTGLIDDVQPESGPDRISLTVRDFGQALDQTVFGHVVGPTYEEPVIFSPPKREKKNGAPKGDPVGHGAKSSGTRKGHSARFVTDDNPKTRWISDDKSSAENTEYVEIKVRKGRYTGVILHPGYDGMDAYISIRATDNGLGDEKPEIDGEDSRKGWQIISTAEGGGIVPGSVDGQVPYVMKLSNLTAKEHRIRFDHVFEIGHDSTLRVSFRKLKKIRNGVYRASCVRFLGLARPRIPMKYKRVALDSGESSHRDGHPSRNVIDKRYRTRWISASRDEPNNTEYIQIRVPQGRYRSVMLLPWYPQMNGYLGVFARPRIRTRANGKKVVMPCLVDGEPLMKFNPQSGLWEPTTDPMWIDMSHPPFNKTGVNFGTVPGSVHGGWPFIRWLPNLEVPGGYPFGSGHGHELKAEKYYFGKAIFATGREHMELALGPDSVIRLGVRNLYEIKRKGRKSVYRASVSHFKGVNRARLIDPKGNDKDGNKKDKSDLAPDVTKRIVVEDLSDIVRVCLRWAGFKEWIVEDTGAGLEGDWKFTRKDTLMGVIEKVAEAVGYTFFIMPPLDGNNSIGMPVFRSSQVLRDDLPVQLVTDANLVTAVQAKITDEPLASRIFVRGDVRKKAKGGKGLGAQREYRYTAIYTPPWTSKGRLAGLKKHTSKDEYRLGSQRQVEVYARLIGLRQAMASATATFSVPGAPQFDLDDQVALLDRGTGLNTRVYIAQLQSVFTTGEQAAWFTTVGGTLLDTPDVVDAKAELLKYIPAGNAANVNDIFITVPGDD